MNTRINVLLKKNWQLITLVIIDTVVKIIINLNFRDVYFKSTNSPFGFNPQLNVDQQSIFNRVFNMGVSTWTLIIINVIALIGLPILFRWVDREFSSTFYKWAYIFVMAGAICSLIDKVFYGGSLDYIVIGRDIWDLKDIYLNLAVWSGVISLFTVKNVETV